MKVTAQQEIEAPIETVFAAVTDFAAYARRARRSGAEVARLDGNGPAQRGATWDIRLRWKGRALHLRPEIIDWSPPSGLVAQSRAGGVTGHLTLRLSAQSPAGTRLDLTLELGAETLSGKLLVQSLRLARGTLEQRIADRLSALAREIEGRAATGGTAAGGPVTGAG